MSDVYINEKPKGPSTLFIEFQCGCQKINLVEEFFADWFDLGSGDSLDFHCGCGKYYKKTSRIPAEAITKSWYEPE